MTDTTPSTRFRPSDAAPELLLGTHLSIVVRARAEFADGSCGPDLGLVIPRQHCEGDMPSERALRVAGRRCLKRLNLDRARRAQRMLIRVEGRWLPLVSSPQVQQPKPASASPSSPGVITMNPYLLSAKTVLAGVGFAALTGGAQLAAAGTPEDNYRKERADCMNGHTQQDRPTCLKEASAALVEARRGNLTTPPADVLAANAAKRCEVQPPKDRGDCERLMRGEGSREGSVAQGGVIREISTIQMDATAAGTPMPAAPPASAPIR